MSPPANTLGFVVWKRCCGAADTRTRPLACSAICCLTNQSGGLGRNPNAMITASASMVSSVPGTTSGMRRPRGPGRSQARLDQLHALHAVRADDFDGLLVEQKGDALFLAVLVVAPRSRHVVFVAPVGAGDAACALADRRTIAIHAGVAAAEHHHALAAHVDEAGRPGVEPQFAIDVGNQIRQRLVHAGQILAGESAFDVGVGSHAEKHRVEFLESAPRRQCRGRRRRSGGIPRPCPP